MEALLSKQDDIYDRMQKSMRNYRKDPDGHKTKQYLELRLQVFDTLWSTFNKNHENLIVERIPRASPYVKDDLFSTVEQFYISNRSEIQQMLETICGEDQAKSESSTTLPFDRKTEERLPNIKLPSFGGKYEDWVPFRDLFTCMIRNNDSLSNVQKLYYLKTHTSGEAEQLIKHFQITEANYAAAWQILIDRYENKRVLVNAELRRLFQQPRITTDSISNIKTLLDTTQECLSALQNLQMPIDEWNAILVYTIVQKLSQESVQLWEQSLASKKDIPTFKELKIFLENRFRTLEAMQAVCRNTVKCNSNTKIGPTRVHHSSKADCAFCGNPHTMSRCPNFLQKSASEKLEVVKSKSLCYNCFSDRHNVRQCPSKFTCLRCKRKHHTQIHEAIALPRELDPTTTKGKETEPNEEIATTSHISQGSSDTTLVLLSTAMVKVSNPFGHEVVARALLDQGSQCTFITESLSQRLRLKKEPILAEVWGIGASNAKPCSKRVSISIFSVNSKLVASKVNALVMKTLTSYPQFLPEQVGTWEHIQGLTLADPNYSRSCKIDLILGADLYPLLLLEGVIRGSKNTPVAQNTRLGWILTGPINLESGSSPERGRTNPMHQKRMASMHGLVDQAQLRAFWELEEVPSIRTPSAEDERCEKIFRESFEKENGRYVVRLPFKENPDPLGESRSTAETRLLQLERKFERNPLLKSEYVHCMNEYLTLNHMSEVEPEKIDLQEDERGYQGCYLPHHAVFKSESSTTKVRIVFNASQKTSNGISLNDRLMTGPSIQENISAILLRWRCYKIVLIADIEKMYLQVRVSPDQTDYQRILWRTSETDHMKHYRLLTVTFGMESSAYLAIRVLKQLAEDGKEAFPAGSKVLGNEFYVDNMMSGADDISQASEKKSQIINLLNEGGFRLKKWASNEEKILRDIPEADREIKENKSIEIDATIKTLGLIWHPKCDYFSYKINFEPTTDASTKRSILSDVSKLYDPLGWISPITITGKIMIQTLWLDGLDWNDKVNQEIKERWSKFVYELHQLETIKIPRWIGMNNVQNSNVQLHLFSDASTQAYAAAVYVRIEMRNKYMTMLLSAKTRIAPVKTVTLPRLELCGAVLAAKLTHQIIKDLKLPHIDDISAWTDSTIVLGWLRGHPSRFKTFVANRLGEIHDKLPDVLWRYVPSKSNPADLATRGIKPQDLATNNLWWNGPPWLSMSKEQWPEKMPIEVTKLEVKETKVSHSTNLTQFNLISKFSSLTKLIRVTAFCLRFLNNCKVSKPYRLTNTLSATELKEALVILIRHAQKGDFRREIEDLQEDNHVHRKSKLLPLHPFLDDKGILRVGGRLQNAPTLLYTEKHPIILSPANPISKMLIRKTHEDMLHGGVQLTLGMLRRKYWILSGRNQTKKIIHECLPCWRQKAKISEQLMGNLPLPRVTSFRPFTHTGVDYFGPLELKVNRTRNSKTCKGYAALFICLTVKAIHLELVSDMTSEAFLAAFRRFISRRGLCSDLYSDQGTNFKGAASIIKHDFKRCVKQIEHEAAETLANDQTTWHFIPPSSPHFGGLWEAGVKSTKFHLKRILGNTKLTFEEMTTLLAQIEATLNSRPLCALTDHPDDLIPLTPGHFLVGEVLTLPPEPSLLDTKENHLNRWQRIQRLHQNFWTRWRREYLGRLQTRPKWLKVNENLHVGELVLLKEEQLPAAKWALGRILEVHQGKDGLVRVATIRTKGSTFVRPITKLCKLPFTNHVSI